MLLNLYFSNILFGLSIVTVLDEWFANKILSPTWMSKLSFYWSLMDDQMTPTQSELLLKKWKDIILKLISTWDFRILYLILGLSTRYLCLPCFYRFQDFSFIFRFRQLALEESTSKRFESWPMTKKDTFSTLCPGSLSKSSTEFSKRFRADSNTKLCVTKSHKP